MLDHESLSIKLLIPSGSPVSERGQNDPLSHAAHLGHLSDLLFEHFRLDGFQNLPLVQLEDPVLLIEFFPFLLVQYRDFREELPPMLAHFQIQLLLRLIETHRLDIFLLKVLALSFLEQVFLKDF